MEELLNEGIDYQVLGSKFSFFSTKTVYENNVACIYNDKVYYLGSEIVNIELAIYFWEYLNNRFLTQKEISSVFLENNIIL